MIELGFLSESEQELILEVLRRDEELRLAEEQRVRKLKSELLEVKRKGAKRGSGKYSERTCARCLEPLSRLAAFSSQCMMCHHDVCPDCRTALTNNSWLCCVCFKESDLKKRTGDWFYDQRVNRFSAAPGHDLVRVSLKKKPSSNKRETAGEVLLKTNSKPPNPVPMPRQKNVMNKCHKPQNSGSTISRESFGSRDEVWSKPTRSDTESAENASIASCKTETESGRVTPDQQRKENRSDRSSPAVSRVSSLTVPVKASIIPDESSQPEVKASSEVKPVCPSPELEVDRLFKKSVKRAPKNPESVSTLDLRYKSESSMGARSRSVPGLDLQEDEEEEEEDIDSLVNFHKTSMASSTSSLQSLRSTAGSLMSIYSEAGDFDSVDVSGDVVFTLSYDEHTQSLHVLIKECHKLAYGDVSRQICNPYVKCYLLPDKSRQSKRKTSIKRHTIDPVYNETLKYSIGRSQLSTRSVLISVWHHGRLSRNAFLGEVEVPLDSRDLDSTNEDQATLMARAASAVPASAFAQDKGELVICLKYVTPKSPPAVKRKGKKAVPEEGGELHILIKEAKSLTAMKSGGTSDSFVKGYLYPITGKSTKRKTPVVKKNLNPHYDHTFVYKDVALEQLRAMCVELTVWDREAMLNNEFLGGVRLSSGKGTVKIGKEEVELDSVGEEVSLWQKMMQYPDSWAEGTLPLRSSMGKAKAK
ncbi:synaptotagmin-like protein 4 [Salarias fasciatus]|uniref:Synaptotagmin-like protein 4 n=1 Tax=Salarias fasciatus TaxID=181472 RepID=A0A672JE00_SALFA|nr:synaptotagmin-like protein 4 [Salarias fasciatus]